MEHLAQEHWKSEFYAALGVEPAFIDAPPYVGLTHYGAEHFHVEYFRALLGYVENGLRHFQLSYFQAEHFIALRQQIIEEIEQIVRFQHGNKIKHKKKIIEIKTKSIAYDEDEEELFIVGAL